MMKNIDFSGRRAARDEEQEAALEKGELCVILPTGSLRLVSTTGTSMYLSDLLCL
jgi:hypothetical protein